MDTLSRPDGAGNDAAAFAKNVEIPMVGAKKDARTLGKRRLKISSFVIFTQLLASEIINFHGSYGRTLTFTDYKRYLVYHKLHP